MKVFLFSLFALIFLSVHAQDHKLAKIVEEIDSKNHLNGTLLVAQNGKILFEKAFGVANRSFDVANKIGTKFLIGSLTKQFTAVLIMQQVEAGKINPDAKISFYLPDFRKETGNKISIRNLLTHTHGIPNASDAERYKPMTKEEYIKNFCEKDLEFEPGTKFNYSNIAGYFLLGLILEKVTSMSYDQLLNERILKPVGMTHSGYLDQKTIIKDFAEGYVRKPDSFENAPYWDMSQSFSAAAMYSTVQDLFLWDQALRTNKLLGAKSLTEIFIPYNSTHYGFGWYIMDPEINGKKKILAGHTGGANGYKSQIVRGIDDNLVVIYLSNDDTFVEVREPIIDSLLTK